MLIFPVYGTYRLEILKECKAEKKIGQCLLEIKLHVTITGAAFRLLSATCGRTKKNGSRRVNETLAPSKA